MQFVISTNARYFPEAARTTHSVDCANERAKRRLPSKIKSHETPILKVPKGARIVLALERQFPRLKKWLSWDNEFEDRSLKV